MRKLRRFLRGKFFPFALLSCLAAAGVLFLALRLPSLLAPVALVERVFSFVAAVLVAAGEEAPERRAGKLFAIAFFPWLGGFFALFFSERRPSVDLLPPVGGELTERVGCLMRPSPALVYADGAEYLADGREFGARFLADLSAATRSVHLEYYIVAQGAFWDRISRILREKAEAGADVRLIYDGFGCSLTLPSRFARDLRKRGVKCAEYGALRFPRRGASRRDHRKIAVIDGTIAYTGGINLADEYVGERIRFGHWKDTAVRLTGEPAARFDELFRSTWDMLRPDDPLPEGKRRAGGKIPCAVIADGTESAPRAGAQALLLMLASAKRYIYLQTPYLAPDYAVLEALKAAAAAGVDVRVMIPHIPDKRAVFAVTRAYARELGRAGVAVREYAGGFLHAKSAALDGEYAFVSSYNLDFRSLRLQAECGALVRDSALCGALVRDFLAAWETGVPVGGNSPLARAAGAALKLFTPLV